ncbi:MAG TPA: hypothetical protein VF051_01275, partial [Hyphomicrobiaceae bacterium]
MLLLVVAPSSVRAQEEDDVPTAPLDVANLMGEPYRLVYDHVTAKFTLYDTDGDVVRGWRDVPAASAQALGAPVPPNRPLELVVVNANSLVYTYGFEATPINSQRVRTCSDLGREFVTQSFFTSTRSLLGTENPVPSLASVLEEADAFRNNEAKTAPSTGDRRAEAFARAKQAVVAYTDLTHQIKTLSVSLQDTLQMIALRAEGEPIAALIDATLLRISQNHGGLSDPRLTPILAARAERNAKDLLTDVLQSGGPADAMSLEAEAMLKRVNAEAGTLRDPIKEVQRSLLQLARARSMARQSTVLLPSEVGRRITITLTAIPDSVARFDVLPVREGNIVAYTRPVVGLLCQISAGLSWMKPAANYEIGRDGVITDKNSADDVRISPAFLFSIGPAALPQVGLLIGLGLGAGGRPDFYLGGSMRALAPIFINAGAVWQREMVLPDGLEVG